MLLCPGTLVIRINLNLSGDLMYPRHPTDGFVISGSIQIEPPLSNDDADRLQAVGMASFRAAIEGGSSALVDALAPDHPDGPSCWVACADGCCLEVDERGYVRIDAIEPWLAYIVGTLHVGHRFSGALMLWDCAERTFNALVLEGTRVRRRRVLEPARTRRGSSRSSDAPRLLKGV